MARKHSEPGRAQAPGVDPYQTAGLAPSFFRFTEPWGICGEDYVRPLNVAKYPFRVPLGWASGLVADEALRAPVSLVLEPISGERLATQINRTVSQADSQPGDGMLSYTERAAKQFQAENAAQINAMLLNENSRIFEATAYAVLRASEPSELRGAKSQLNNSVMNSCGARVEKQLSNTRGAFFAASPCLSPDEAGRLAYAVPMPAETVAMGEFMQSYGFDDMEGVMVGTDPKAGAPIRLNFQVHSDARPTGNIAFVAESGNGKSHAMKLISITEHLVYGTRLLVLSDPDSEYGRAAVKFGGEVTDPVGKLSPFEPRNVSNADTPDEGDGDAAAYYARARATRVISAQVPFLKTFIQTAWPIVDDATASFLGRPISEVYKAVGIDEDTTFEEYFAGPQVFPDFADLYRELMAEVKQADAEGDSRRGDALYRAAAAIEDVAIGYDASVWNTHESFRTDTDFVVVDTSGLSGDKNVAAAQLYNIFMWAWSEVRSHRFDDDSYTRIVLDELASIVNEKSPRAAEMVADMMRRVRKYNAGVMFATQTFGSLRVEKIAEAGKTILDCTSYKFFSAQSGKGRGSNLGEVQEYLSLTDQVRDELGGAEKGVFLAVIGKRDKTWVRIDPPPEWMPALFGRSGGR